MFFIIISCARIVADVEVAADAQLQGPSSGIDAHNLVEALDTLRRLAFALGNAEPNASSVDSRFDGALRAITRTWHANIREQLESGHLHDAPLRAMVADSAASGLSASLQIDAAPDLERRHIAKLIHTLEHQLATVRLD